MEQKASLVEKARRGEESAFQELFRVCRPAVVRLLEAFSTLDHDDREDIVQDTFTRAFRGLPRLKATVAFDSWLLAIARNRALTAVARRSASERVRGELRHEQPDATELLPPAWRVELDLAVVRELIARLPEGPEKETVRLFYVEGELSAREIGERLGVGKSAVTMRLERFRARVKRELLARLVKARWE